MKERKAPAKKNINAGAFAKRDEKALQLNKTCDTPVKNPPEFNPGDLAILCFS